MEPRTPAAAGGTPLLDAAARGPCASVTTRMVFDAAPGQVWECLLFYEQVELRPPLHLRLLLPAPIETVGPKSQVGDEARCIYEGGYLIKRVTQVEPGVSYGFEVVEQSLEVGGGMQLAGGDYALREIAPGRVEVRATTRYWSPKRPRWMWRTIERVVCHAFHRHILRAMKRSLGGAGERS